jgi:hypothetical protein
MKVLAKKEPIPNVIIIKRSRNLSIKGQIRKIRNADNAVKSKAERKLSIVRPGVMSEIK